MALRKMNLSGLDLIPYREKANDKGKWYQIG